MMEASVAQKRIRTPREEYVRIVNKWRSSGLSQQDFCREHGYPLPRFQRWVWRCNVSPQEVPAVGRIRISNVVGAKSTDAFFEIIYPNGVKLRMHQFPGMEVYASLIRF